MVQVVGHRGAAGIEPENTLRGFRRAIELGAGWVECDVRLTSDRRLIVMHDETVDRTTNRTGAVRDLTFDRVRALDAGKGERVPTLAEVLEAVRGKARLQLELKGPGTARPAVRAVKALGMDEEVMFVSFHLGRLRQVKRADASLQVGAIFEKAGARACERSAAAGAGLISVFYKNLTWGLVEEAHRRGLEAAAWSPDKEAEWRAMIALGADMVATNRPDRLMAMLRGRP